MTWKGYIVGIIGVWLVSDSIWSICYYLDKPNEKFWHNHSVRVLRLILAVVLVGIGLWV